MLNAGKPLKTFLVLSGLTFLTVLLIFSTASTLFANFPTQTKLVILHTSNTFGDLTPTNYFSGLDEYKGAAYLAQYLREIRSQEKNVLVIDTGNWFIGTPFGDYYYSRFIKTDDRSNPLLSTFNSLGYDFFVPGTFELNQDRKSLEKLFSNLQVKILGVNISNIKNIVPFEIRSFENGLRVAVIGVLPEIGSHSFTPYIEAVRKVIDRIESTKAADVIVIATSMGLKVSPVSRTILASDSRYFAGDEIVKAFSSKAHVFLFGNQQIVVSEAKDGRVYSLPPSNLRGVNQIELSLTRESKGWTVRSANITVVNFSKTWPEQSLQEDLRFSEFHVKKWLEEPLATLPTPLPFNTYLAILEDNPVTDFIGKNLIRLTKADISVWGIFNTGFKGLPAGQLKRIDVYSMVGATTSVKVYRIRGWELEKLLARSLAYMGYKNGIVSFSKEIQKEPWIVDLFEGISYDVVLNRRTVTNVKFKGQQIEPNRDYLVAIPTLKILGEHRISLARPQVEVEYPLVSMILESLEKDVSLTVDLNRKTVIELSYVVQSGDTLKRLESRLGVSQAELLRLNPFIKDPNILRPGWTIIYYRNYLELVPPIANFFSFEN